MIIKTILNGSYLDWFQTQSYCHQLPRCQANSIRMSRWSRDQSWSIHSSLSSRFGTREWSVFTKHERLTFKANHSVHSRYPLMQPVWDHGYVLSWAVSEKCSFNASHFQLLDFAASGNVLALKWTPFPFGKQGKKEKTQDSTLHWG